MDRSDDRSYYQISTPTVNYTAVSPLACHLIKNAKQPTVHTDLMVSNEAICSGSTLFSTQIKKSHA